MMDHDSRPRHVCPELPRFLQPSIGNLVSSRPGIATENGTTLASHLLLLFYF